MSECSRRDFLKCAGVAGGALAGLDQTQLLADKKIAAALIKTDDRKKGVKNSLKALRINPVKNKDVLIKPNFNTADACPGSTHNDTLVAPGGRTVGNGRKINKPRRTELSSHPPSHAAERNTAAHEGSRSEDH